MSIFCQNAHRVIFVEFPQHFFPTHSREAKEYDFIQQRMYSIYKGENWIVAEIAQPNPCMLSKYAYFTV